jgi:hypothetical protein
MFLKKPTIDSKGSENTTETACASIKKEWNYDDCKSIF